MRFYWQTRASVRADSWNLQFAVVVDGQVVGACDLGAEHVPGLRQFKTGSWLGREFQAQGLGKEFRMAALSLGFDGLGGGGTR
jgi:RimJ/RimL family protein N-acetyltransferase